MNILNREPVDLGAFDDLFDLDVRVESGTPMGRCNTTDDGCSNSCTSVGCSATCHCK